MLAFPVSPSVGQKYLTWQWDGSKWVPAPSRRVVPECGRFQIVGSSPSQIVTFTPYNGNLIQINGLIYPFAATNSAATPAYIDGVSGGSLAPNTLYYVYMWYNPTLQSLVLDFSKTGHATSTTPGNEGVEIKSGDDSRTLVGIVMTSSTAPGSNTFVDGPVNRRVASWFNKQARWAWNTGSLSHLANSSPVSNFGTDFVGWNGENFVTEHSWNNYGDQGGGANTYIYWNGSQTPGVMTVSVIAGLTLGGHCNYANYMMEGLNNISPYYSVFAGGTQTTFTGVIMTRIGPG